MEQTTRRDVISAGIAAGALLLSGTGPASAKQITFKDFMHLIEAFVKANSERIARAYGSRGGWEKWLQTELGGAITDEDSTYEVSREQPVYKNSRETVDFLFNGPFKENPHVSIGQNTILIELKCQSLYSDADLKTLMLGDMTKLSKSNLNDQYQAALHPPQRYAIGASLVERNDMKGFQSLVIPTPHSMTTRSETKNPPAKSADQAAWVYWAQVTS
jgi:hypothetical protein